MNDAWSDNWGFVPLTDAEIAYAGKKLKPIIVQDLVKIAEVDGELLAFMITLPDLNEMIRDPTDRPIRLGKAAVATSQGNHLIGCAPLMGGKSLQRAAGQPAGLHADRSTCRVCVDKYGIYIGEFGWVLEDNHK